MRQHLLFDVPAAAAAIAAVPSLGWGALAGAGAASLLLHAWGTVNPRSSLYLPVWWRLPRTEPGCAVTFDDGPHPEVTPRLLDRLAAQQLPATFFLIGAHAAAHPALVRRIRAEGHALGLHSHSHSRLFNCWGPRRLCEDLRQGADAIAQATGEPPPRLFRPPVGLKNPMVGVACARLGLVAVTWSARARDTRTQDPVALLARLTPRLAPRAIVLLHDGHEPNRPGPRQACVAVVDGLATALRARALPAVRLTAADGGLSALAAAPAAPAPAR